MGKKISIFFSITVIFILLTFTLNTFNVRAIVDIDFVNDNNLTDYATYLNSIANNDSNIAEYYQDKYNVIKYYYPNFNVNPTTFESRVSGTNAYKILEVTPDSYLGDPSTVSDLMTNVNDIKTLYKNKITSSNFSNRFVLTNMQNFEVRLMTIKEFVASRETLSGVYDAIVFTGSDNYNPGEQVSCKFNVDLSKLEYKTIKDGNKKIRYEGYFLGSQYHGEGKVYDQNGKLTYDGQFNNGEYHGQGDLYDQNGRLTYTGGWNNGQKECFGKYYDQNGRLRYEGKWLNDNRHGYGTSYDQNGRFEYEGYWENDLPVEQTSLEILNDITELKSNEVINEFVKKGLPVFIHDDVYNYENSHFNTFFKNLKTQYPNNVFTLTNDRFSVLETAAIMATTEFLSIKPYLKINTKPIDYYTNGTNQYRSGDVLNFNFELTNKSQATMIFYVDINQNNVIEKQEVADSKALVKGINSFSYQIPAKLLSGLLKYQIEVIADGLVSRYEGTVRIKAEQKVINVVNIVSEMVYNKSNLLDPVLKDLYFKNNGDYTINLISCNVKDIGNNGSNNDCSHSIIFDPTNNEVDVVLLGQDIFDKNLNTPTYNSIQNYVDHGKPLIFTSSITKGKDKWQKYFSDDLLLADYRTDSYKINNANRLQIMNVNSFNAYPNNIIGQELIVPEDLNYAFNENFQLDLEEIELVPLLNMYKNNPYNLDRFDAYNNFYYMQANNVVYLNVGNNSYSVYKEIEHKLLANAIINLHVAKNANQAALKDYYSISLLNNYNNTIINVTDPVNFDFAFITNVEGGNYNYKVKVDSATVVEGSILKNVNETVNLTNIANPNIHGVEEVYISIEITNSQNRQIYDYGFKVYVANIQNYVKVTQSLNMTDTKNVNDQIGINSLYNLDYKIDYQTLDLSRFNNPNLPSTLILKNLSFKEILPANVTQQNLDPSLVAVKNANNETVITKTLPDVILTYSNGKYVPNVPSSSIRIPIKVSNVGSYTINQGSISVNGITSDNDVLSLGNQSFSAVKVLNETLVTKNFTNNLFIPFEPNGSSYAYLPELITVDKDVKVTSITYNILNAGDRFVYNSQTNNLVANNVGTATLQVIVKDIFDKVVTKEYTVLSYEPVDFLEVNNFVLNIDQQSTLILNDQIPLVYPESLQYTIRNINTTSSAPIVEIIFENGFYYVKPVGVGSAEVTFTGYDAQGNTITSSGVIIVKEPSSLQFTQNYIPLFINGSFNLANIVNIVECTKVDQTVCTFADITWTSSDNTIITIGSNGAIQATSKAGFAIVEGTLPNGDSAQILVKVSDYISADSGFDRIKLDNRNLYDNYPYNLMNFVKALNIDLTNVQYEFTHEILSGIGTVNINANNEMTVTISDYESITIKLMVKITQTLPDGSQIVINDYVILTITGGYGNY